MPPARPRMLPPTFGDPRRTGRPRPPPKGPTTDPGTFSIGLAVKDLAASKRFYEKLASFTDVRELQRRLESRDVALQQEADERTTGPAGFVDVDPDGHPVPVDRHVWAEPRAKPRLDASRRGGARGAGIEAGRPTPGGVK